ncbi:DUF4162 domain-containing protein, partial [Streptomyces hebeiensis]
ANGSVEGLKAQVGGRMLQIRPTHPGELSEMARCLAESGITGATASADTGLLAVAITGEDQLTAVIGVLGTRGFGIAAIDTKTPSLDEVFLAITGQPTSSLTGSGAGSADEETQR